MCGRVSTSDDESFLLSPIASLDAQSMDSRLRGEACLCHAESVYNDDESLQHMAGHALQLMRVFIDALLHGHAHTWSVCHNTCA